MESVLESPPAAVPRPTCETEWGAFVDVYGRAILEWLRQAGLTNDEAATLGRDLLTLVAGEFAQIVDEPTVRFRAWLQYAAHAAWGKLMEACVDEGGSSSPILTLLLSVEAHDLFMTDLDAECTNQRRREVLPRAQALADPDDWEAFYMTVLREAPPIEVAADMQSPELTVHAGAFRVGRLLRDEMRKLEDHC